MYSTATASGSELAWSWPYLPAWVCVVGVVRAAQERGRVAGLFWSP